MHDDKDRTTGSRVVDVDATIAGIHTGTITVRDGANLAVSGTLRGTLSVEAGTAVIDGTIQGSLRVGPDSRVVIRHRQLGAVEVAPSGEVVVESRGRLAGALRNDGRVVLRGEFGGTTSGQGELVEDGGRIVPPSRSTDGASIYEWPD